MKFQKLSLDTDIHPVKKWFRSPQFKRSLISVSVGAAGFALYYYFTEGQRVSEITIVDLGKSILIGGVLGYFISNSPCTRGRC